MRRAKEPRAAHGGSSESNQPSHLLVVPGASPAGIVLLVLDGIPEITPENPMILMRWHPARFLRLLLGVCVAAGVVAHPLGLHASERCTVVMVHGAFGGGWDWKNVGDWLVARGHTVYRPSLTGLGDRVHLSSPEIRLETHILDIVNLIRFEGLSNVVLTGHSYAGMVLTGVMDRIPERLKRVIFLDAAIPNDGESFVGLQEALGMPREKPPADGFVTWPGMSTNAPAPHHVPQPWKTVADPVTYRNPAARKVPVTFVFFLDQGQRPEIVEEKVPDSVLRHTIWKRAKERGWEVERFEADHLAERSKPKELAAFIEQVFGKVASAR